MKRRFKKLTKRFYRLVGFESLCFVLVGFVLFQPLLETYVFANSLFISIFLIFLVGTTSFITDNKNITLLTAVLVAIAIVMEFLPLNEAIREKSTYLQGLNVGIILTLVLRDIFFGPRTLREKLYASVAGFFLIAILGALIYHMILLYNPLAIKSDGVVDVSQFSTLVYFSVSTLTTLGYGDIVPAAPIARTVTILLGITGQLYVVILISRLVAHIKFNKAKEDQSVFEKIF
ncbi:MAG: ion channel [Candidatus Gracilibacteria bacterium]|nr:ion channel [Candidatus Gracilibacteria bacterium]